MNPPTVFPVLEYHAPELVLPAAANAVLPFGNLVARDADNNAVLAADAAGLTIAGVASGVANFFNNDQTVVNTGRQAGANKVRVKTGLYRFVNSAAAPITSAELGKSVFVEDERTVARTTSHSILAGIAVGLESNPAGVVRSVWVFVGPVGTLPGSPSLGYVPPEPPPAS